jgi:hypothetical protein
MGKRALTRLTGTLIAILTVATSGAATSQTAPTQGAQVQVLNSQVQLGDVFSQQQLHVTTSPDIATAATSSVGNSFTATGENQNLQATSTQTLGAKSAALTSLVANQGADTLVGATTSAVGNTATFGTCCGLVSGSARQIVTSAGQTTADSYVGTGGGPTGQVSVDSSAVANTQGWEVVNGTTQLSATQSNQGLVRAYVNATICCVSGPSGYAATAVGNNVTVDATKSSVNAQATQDQATAPVQATVLVNQTTTGDFISAATATANNINIAADTGTTSLTSTQTNSSAVSADNEVQLQAWSGTATVSSYGVGNSAIASNAGPQTNMTVSQTNNGDVSATASFTGGDATSGGVNLVSTAVGNAASGYACPSCQGGVGANNTQVNNGGVRATSTATVNGAATVNTQASAVGNTATYQVKSGH